MQLFSKHPRGSQLCVDFKIRGKLAGIKYPCIVEVKYDGTSVTVIKQGNAVIMNTDKFSRGIFDKHDDDDDFKIGIQRDGIYLAEWIHFNGKWDSLYSVKDNKIRETRLKVFDVLSIEGVDVSEKDLLTRKEILAYAISKNTMPGSKMCNNADEVRHWFKVAVDRDYEGIIVKNLNETFLGQRWVKMKPTERMTHGTTTSSDE